MERRREPRIPHNIRFFVRVGEFDESPDLVGVSIACSAINFWKQDLQFSTAAPLPIGTVMSITIGIGDTFAMYLLGGVIRRVREGGDAHYMGVMPTEGDQFDTEKWAEDYDSVFSGEV